MIPKYEYIKLKTFVKKYFFPEIYKQEKFPNKPVVHYKTKIGNYFLPVDAPYDYIAMQMRKGEVFEQEVVDLARQYIRKDSCVLDIGANFGQMSLLFAEMVGKKGQVLAFEANNYVFHILHKNIEANNIKNVRPYLRAVYNQSNNEIVFPNIDFKKWTSYGSYGLNPQISTGTSVKTLSIDDLDIKMPISFMKVDIQGADLFALQGAVKTIEKHKMPILFEYEEQFQEQFGTSFNDYIEFVRSIGYKFEKTIDKINYLIVPDTKKSFTVKHNPINNIDQNIYQLKLCKFLKNAKEIYDSTQYLFENGYFPHNLECKNWDIANIVPQINSGRFLDMGSSDSYILKNLDFIKFEGELHGIDLRKPNVPLDNVKYVVGDLLKTPYPNDYFKNVTCLSVIEHEVDFDELAKETSRILEKHGRLFITFDYWNPRINTQNKMLFGLKWNILDKADVERLVISMKNNDLILCDSIDYETDKAVIDKYFGSPDKKYKYTFGMLVFEKNNQ